MSGSICDLLLDQRAPWSEALRDGDVCEFRGEDDDGVGEVVSWYEEAWLATSDLVWSSLVGEVLHLVGEVVLRCCCG